MKFTNLNLIFYYNHFLITYITFQIDNYNLITQITNPFHLNNVYIKLNIVKKVLISN